MIKITHYPDIIPWFKEQGCEGGISFTYHVCQIIHYAMSNFQLNGEIRTYMSSKLNHPMINVDFHEYMDAHTEKRTKELIDRLVTISIVELNDISEYQCMIDRRITIPIVYSFFNRVVE